MITHTHSGVVRPRVAVARLVPTDARLDEAVLLRHLSMQRKAFRSMAVSYPANVLRLDAVSNWVRRTRVTLDVNSDDQLDLVMFAGAGPSQAVMHCANAPLDLVRRGVDVGVSRFVVNSSEQVTTLAGSSATKQRVLIDAAASGELVAELVARRQLDLVGLYCSLDGTAPAELNGIVDSLIGRMATITRKHSVVLSRVSLGDVKVAGSENDPRDLRRQAEAINQAVEDGCIHWRYPRPALTVSVDRSDLQSCSRS